MNPPEEGKGASAPLPSGAAAVSVSLDEFRRVALKIGVVVSAQDHPNADRLLILSVDLGDGQLRQLVAGIKGMYQAAELVGKRVVVVANLQPATIRGVESQGMILAAHDASGLALISSEKPIQAGSLVK